MAFDSYFYILLFLPVAAAGYFALQGLSWARAWLLICGLAFYTLADLRHLPILACSLLINYGLTRLLAPRPGDRGLLFFGILFNLLAFLWLRWAAQPGPSLASARFGLPLALGVFTLQQIALLVEAYRGRAVYGFLDHGLCVAFFPQLLAGPISLHREILPQLGRPKGLDYSSLARGLLLFSLGLFKKTMLADSFGVWARAGFTSPGELNLLEAWLACFSNTLQIYFDFSGLMDMASGSALAFGVELPSSFDSPYQALDIRDFWRRWHKSLGRWLRAYVARPLAGRLGKAPSVLIVFLAASLWYGAGGTFLVWGLLNAAAFLWHRSWLGSGLRCPRPLAWLLTFLFVNASWVLYRASSLAEASKLLRGMTLGPFPPAGVDIFQSEIPARAAWAVALGLLICLLSSNSSRLAKEFRPSWRHALLCFFAFLLGLLGIGQMRDHLYLEF